MGNIVNIVADNVKKLREERGWSQQELADRAGLSVPGVQGIEYKTRWPQPATIERLASAFAVHPGALFDVSGVMPKAFPKPTPAQAMDVIHETLASVSRLSPAAWELVSMLPALNDAELGALADWIRTHTGLSESVVQGKKRGSK